MIRKINAKEFEKAAQLWLDASLKAHHFIDAAYWKNNLQNMQNFYLPKSETFVFEDKRKIKGFISVTENNYIAALFVDPSFQRKKIGSKLLSFIRKKYSHLCLKVYVKNLPAISFYQKNDFKIIAERTDTLTNEKELIMSWVLGCKSGFSKRYSADS